MAGEHFESCRLDLCILDNKQLDQRCNMLSNIVNTDQFIAKLSPAIGYDRAIEILEKPEL